MLVEKGNLKEVKPLKVLLGVVEANLTGILYFKKDDILKVLYFNNGKLTWAISKDVKDSLFSLILEKKLIEQNVLEDIIHQVNKEENFAKKLVELGLLSLENLIDLTKEQLKRIVISVLDWEYGTFQFVKDTPPDRFFSLDIDVVFYIKQYIANIISLDKIWHVIGSMQNEFIYSINDDKFKLLKLTDSQRDLLYKFKGDVNLETILARYNSEQRDSVLRNVYFFLETNLLIKREFDTFAEDLDVNETEQEIEEKFKEIAENKEEQKGFEKPEVRTEINFDDGFEKPLQNNDFDEKDVDELLKNSQEKKDDYVFEDKEVVDSKDFEKPESKKDGDFDVHEYIKKEHKSSSKLYFILILLVVLFFVIGGIIFIIISSNKVDKEFSKNNAIEVSEPKTIKSNKTTINNKALTENKIENSENKNNIKNTQEVKNKEEQNTTQPKEKIKTEVKPIKKQQDKNLTNNSELVSKALTYLEKKRFLIAIDLWKQVLINSGYKYSILIELDCLKSSVLYSYKKFKNKKNFFILSKVKNGRQCYLVFWGRFLNKEEAKIGLKSIPEYFWKQSDPPEVVELSIYLK